MKPFILFETIFVVVECFLRCHLRDNLKFSKQKSKGYLFYFCNFTCDRLERISLTTNTGKVYIYSNLVVLKFNNVQKK